MSCIFVFFCETCFFSGSLGPLFSGRISHMQPYVWTCFFQHSFRLWNQWNGSHQISEKESLSNNFPRAEYCSRPLGFCYLKGVGGTVRGASLFPKPRCFFLKTKREQKTMSCIFVFFWDGRNSPSQMTPSQNRMLGFPNSRFPYFFISTVSRPRSPILWIIHKRTWHLPNIWS